MGPREEFLALRSGPHSSPELPRDEMARTLLAVAPPTSFQARGSGTSTAGERGRSSSRSVPLQSTFTGSLENLRVTSRKEVRGAARKKVWTGPRAESPYDVLGVPRNATDKQIKSAYRKLALKYHPDVNKAPDAEKQFLRIKSAYQALTEPAKSSSGASRPGGGYSSSGSSSWGSSSSGGFAGFDFDYESGQWKKATEEAFYGLEDFFKDLSEDLEKRRKDGRQPKSLWEELADLGEEFVEYLEKNLPVDDKAQSNGSTSSSSRQTSNASTSDSYSSSTNRSYSGSTSSGSAQSSQKTSWQAPPKKPTEADIDEELQKLKREMGL